MVRKTASVLFLFSTIIISSCLNQNNSFVGEISDPKEYPAIMNEVGNENSLSHFPPDIPKGSDFVRFHYQPNILQGGNVLQLRVRLSQEKVQFIRAKHIIDALQVIPQGEKQQYKKASSDFCFPNFYTSDTNHRDWPESYEILILGSESLGSEDFPWNHGVCFGVSISTNKSEIIYWYEDW